MEAKNFLMKYVTFTVKDMNLLIQDLDLIQTFMAHIYYLRAKRCDACSKNLFEDDTIHDCNEDLSIVLDECFESVKANVEKDITYYSPGFPGLENLEKEIMALLDLSFYSEIKYKLIELNSQVGIMINA
jgi:hypothetical protein